MGNPLKTDQGDRAEILDDKGPPAPENGKAGHSALNTGTTISSRNPHPLQVVGQFFKHIATSLLDLLNRIETGLEPHLKLGTIAAIAALASFIVGNYVEDLRDQRDRLTTALESERAQAQEQMRSRDKMIHDLLPSSLNAPLPISPQNGTNLVGPFVILKWEERDEQAHPNYLVEIIQPDPGRAALSAKPLQLVATDPRSRSTRYPIKLDEGIPPGSYLWRVVPGDRRGDQTVLAGNWSGYYRFTIYPKVLDRIIATGKLLVGVSYIQDSDFMRRDERGNAWGMDADLLSEVSKSLGTVKPIEKKLDIEIVDYPDVDTVLFKGLLAGEVDLAIGSITKAAYRERRGVRFTRGYFDSHLVLIARSEARGMGSFLDLRSEDKIGVVKRTTNAKAAADLKRLRTFKLVEKDSFQDLVRALEFRELDFVVIDEPLARPLVARGEVKIVQHLSRYLDRYFKDEIGYKKEEYAIAAADSGLRDLVDGILATGPLQQKLHQLRSTYRLTE